MNMDMLKQAFKLLDSDTSLGQPDQNDLPSTKKQIACNPFSVPSAYLGAGKSCPRSA